MISWKNSFLFSKAPLSLVLDGHAHRTELTQGQRPEIRPAQVSSILRPEVMGIYQSRVKTFDCPDVQDEYNRMAFTVEGFVESIFTCRGIQDKNHKDLILIAYDPSIWQRSVLEQSIGDRLGGIMLTTADNMPNPYSKPLDFYDDLLHRFNVLTGMSLERLSAGDIPDLKQVSMKLKVLGKDIDLVQKKLQPYGMTRHEYFMLEGLGMMC